MADNRHIAECLYLIADYLEIRGENPFRVKAYRNAGDTLLSLSVPVSKLGKPDLTSLPGIGRDIAGKIAECTETGSIGLLEQLKAEVPAGLLEMKKIPGLGPKKIFLLHRELGIDSVESLKKAIEEGKLGNLAGMGAKTIHNIMAGIEFYLKSRERIPLGEASTIAEEIVSHLEEPGLPLRVETVGSVRRMKETVGDINLLVISKNPAGIVEKFLQHPSVTEVLEKEDVHAKARMGDTVVADLVIVPKKQAGCALLFFTGSKEHVGKIISAGRRKNIEIMPERINDAARGKILPVKDEEEIYSLLGMDYIPPELREDRGEVEAALTRSLPRLVESSDVKGELHLHSDWSDGHHTLEELVEIIRAAGFSYFAVTDHSQSLRIAGGLNEREIMQQMELIARLNEQHRDVQILSGIEVDILKDGKLDLPYNILRRLDFVTGSIHSGFQMTREKATERIIRAIETGLVDMIGHLSGRMFGERSGYEVEVEKVVAKAKEYNVILELNSHPKRLDIPAVTCKMAKDAGVKVAVTTDMHYRGDLENLRFGIGTARRGWLEPGDVVNTWDVDRVKEFIRKRRG